MKNISIDKLFEELPDSIKASEHSDVKTIIQIWRDEEVIGNFTDGTNGIQRSCSYKIIDLNDSICFLKGELKGNYPPYTKRHGGNAYGSDPTYELKQIIIKNIGNE